MPPSRNASSVGGISAITNPMLGTKLNRNDTTPHRSGVRDAQHEQQDRVGDRGGGAQRRPDLDVDDELRRRGAS